MKRIARLSCEGGTGTARRRSAMSQAARTGSQVAQWTTPSRARQNVIPSQRQHGFRSFTAVLLLGFSPRVMPLLHTPRSNVASVRPVKREREGAMRCSKCGADNREGRKFCAECGEALASKCPRCGATNESREKFCGECGAALGRSQSAPTRKSNETQIRIAETSPPENLEGERKTVTALFADIKGSTELQQDLDPEQARAIIDPALKIMIDAARHYDGYVQSAGDGIFALFGAPAAHEDHPQRAIHAALRMQQEIRHYGDRLLQRGGVPIEIRVGVNTGEVVMRPLKTGDSNSEYAPIGLTTNLASRMQAVARSGSIVVSEATRKLVEGYFQLKSIGPTKVKGVSEPIQVYEVTGLGPLRTRLQVSASRGYTKFVGREREMEALTHTATLAEGGRGQIVAVVADPGVGKSRLLFEFKARNQSGWTALESFSVSHGKTSPYLPVVELLYSYFDIKREDDARKKRERTTGKVLALDRSLEDALPPLFGLLGIFDDGDPLSGMNSETRRRRTINSVKRILLRESLNQPLMLTFEDLHWIDRETQELLNLLADSIASSKILLLVNYRPEYSHQWARKTYYTQLHLDPLGRESAEEMLDALLGAGAEFALKHFIIERAEGNPLFMEEIAQALFEEGALVRNGAVKATKPLAALKIPSTLQGVLASRIDRLPAVEKELLQTLAVIGREFPLSLIRAVSPMSSDYLDQAIANLQLVEFIYEQPAEGDVEYIFKHALTQQVAHESLLSERRKDLHEQVGNAIEKLYGDCIEQHLARLANHYRQSRNVGKAIEFLQRAAEQAAERSAVAEAESLLRDAIGMLLARPHARQRDLHEFELQSALVALLNTRSFGAPEKEQPLRRAYELSEQIGDGRKTLYVLFQLGQLYIQQARFSEAKKSAELAAEQIQHFRDPILEACTLENLGECYWWCGDLQKARAHFERTRAICETTLPSGLIRSVGFDLWIFPAIFLSITNVLMGRPDRAMEFYNALVTRPGSSAHPYSRLVGLVILNWMMHQLRGDLIDVEYERVSKECEEHGLYEVAGWAAQFSGWFEFWRGKRKEGIAKMTEAIEKLNAVNSFNMLPWRLILLAEMKAEIGEIQAAETLVDQALKELTLSQEGWYLPEVYRVAAKVVLCNSPADPNLAERHLRHAIDLARNQGTKLWELRATTSLAHLLCDTSRQEEARTMLAGVYGRFTEGFDTADLKDAKALLKELSNPSL
jgi:class 3 adenylate cyclase/tetratricopeptide (TPR) repeat protein